MKTKWMMTAALAIGLAMAACSSKPAADAKATEVEKSEKSDAKPAAAKAEDTKKPAPVAGEGTLELTLKGANIDPPVEVARIPDGAYYCDMGTVHYARMEKGDETCPRCSMKLTHKLGDAPEKKPAELDEHHGHEH